MRFLLLLLVAVVVTSGCLNASDSMDTIPQETNDQEIESSPETEESPEEPASENVVEMTGNSFSPSTLTISAGETVIFRNVGSNDVWPASARHPTHEEYPGFDANRGIGPGEEYSFTFSDVGEWGYHDHLRSSVTGTIIVES